MRTFPLLGCLLACLPAIGARPEPPAWIVLVGETAGAVWSETSRGWIAAGDVTVDAKNPRRLVARAGKGTLVNGKTGREHDLVTRASFGDVELELEFFIPKGSNSGVKFHGLYEIQICDSFGKKELTGGDCGGIYPRAELTPVYRHLDTGVAPRSNACKAPGRWQKLNAIFLAPRFDAAGTKTANARLLRVTLNGTLIHEKVALKTPTGHNWRKPEAPTGPLLLQGDHGPVAFRNVRVRPYIAKNE